MNNVRNLLSVSDIGIFFNHAFKMKLGNDSRCVPFLFFVMSFGCCYVGGNVFEEVQSCPVNAEEWENRGQKKNCQEPIPYYICAAIENRPGRFGEICTQAGLSEPGTINQI